jgi:hypothetical protein
MNTDNLIIPGGIGRKKNKERKIMFTSNMIGADDYN